MTGHLIKLTVPTADFISAVRTQLAKVNGRFPYRDAVLHVLGDDLVLTTVDSCYHTGFLPWPESKSEELLNALDDMSVRVSNAPPLMARFEWTDGETSIMDISAYLVMEARNSNHDDFGNFLEQYVEGWELWEIGTIFADDHGKEVTVHLDRDAFLSWCEGPLANGDDPYLKIAANRLSRGFHEAERMAFRP